MALDKNDGTFSPSIEGVISGKTSQVTGMNGLLNDLIGNDNYLKGKKLDRGSYTGTAEDLSNDTKSRFPYVNTIEDLKKQTKYAVGDIVEVLGYYEKGDGAGHKRQKKHVGYNGADAVIGTDGSIWGIVHNGEVNVSWFGARCDGVTDDTSFFEKAYDFCGFIDLGFRTYKIQGVFSKNKDTVVKNGKIVTDNFFFKGVENAGHEYNNTFKFLNLTIESSNNDYYSVEFKHTSISSNQERGLLFDNCVFRGSLYTSSIKKGSGVYVGQSSSLVFNNCRFYFLENAICTTDMNNVFFTNTSFSNNNNIICNFTSDVVNNCGYNYSNCIFIANTNISFEVDSLCYANTLFDYNIGVSLSGTSLSLVGCYLGLDNLNSFKANASTNMFSNTRITHYSKNESSLEVGGRCLFSACDFENGNSFVRTINAEITMDCCKFDTLSSNGVIIYGIGAEYLSLNISDSDLTRLLNKGWRIMNYANYTPLLHVVSNCKGQYQIVEGFFGAGVYQTILNNNKVFDIDKVEVMSNSVSELKSKKWAVKDLSSGVYLKITDNISQVSSFSIKITYNLFKTYSLKNVIAYDTIKMQSLDTPYHASNMQKLGILDEYHNYLSESHEYEKSQNVQDGTMNLNIPQPPVIPAEVETYAKEYNLI
ncbi:MAG: hypothetical protein ACRCX2_18425 [Paraclostridium sp.]